MWTSTEGKTLEDNQMGTNMADEDIFGLLNQGLFETPKEINHVCGLARNFLKKPDLAKDSINQKKKTTFFPSPTNLLWATLNWTQEQVRHQITRTLTTFSQALRTCGSLCDWISEKIEQLATTISVKPDKLSTKSTQTDEQKNMKECIEMILDDASKAEEVMALQDKNTSFLVVSRRMGESVSTIVELKKYLFYDAQEENDNDTYYSCR